MLEEVLFRSRIGLSGWRPRRPWCWTWAWACSGSWAAYPQTPPRHLEHRTNCQGYIFWYFPSSPEKSSLFLEDVTTEAQIFFFTYHQRGIARIYTHFMSSICHLLLLFQQTKWFYFLLLASTLCLDHNHIVIVVILFLWSNKKLFLYNAIHICVTNSWFIFLRNQSWERAVLFGTQIWMD